jgi:hypothetical protein
VSCRYGQTPDDLSSIGGLLVEEGCHFSQLEAVIKIYRRYSAAVCCRCGRAPLDLSSIVLVEEGCHFLQSDAIINIYRRLPMPAPLIAGAISILPKIVRDALYDQVRGGGCSETSTWRTACSSSSSSGGCCARVKACSDRVVAVAGQMQPGHARRRCFVVLKALDPLAQLTVRWILLKGC